MAASTQDADETSGCESLPALVSSDDSDPMPAGQDKDESKTETSDFEDDLGSLFSPLALVPHDPTQALLAKLGHQPQQGQAFLPGLSPGFLASRRNPLGTKFERGMARDSNTEASKNRRVSAKKKSRGGMHSHETVAAPTTASLTSGASAGVASAVSPQTSAKSHAKEQIVELLNEVDVLRDRLAASEQERNRIEDLYARAMKDHEAHEAELDLLRDIRRTELKKEKKGKAKQLKLSKVGAAATASVSEQYARFDQPPPLDSGLSWQSVEPWIFDGAEVSGLYGTQWYPGRIIEICREKEPIQFGVRWDDEFSMSYLAIHELRPRVDAMRSEQATVASQGFDAASERRVADAEARAQDAEKRAEMAEEQCRQIEEQWFALLRQRSDDELAKMEKRAVHAENRADDLERSLQLLHTEACDGRDELHHERANNARLLHEMNSVRCSERAAREEVQSLRSHYAPTVEQLRQRDELLRALYPALWRTIRWIAEGNLNKLEANTIRQLPVLALRWSHNDVNKNACFSDDRSIYLAVDELMRGRRSPDHWFREHNGYQDLPDVMLYDGRLHVATANRRLTALMMVQALNRSSDIQISCKIRSIDDPRWREKLLGSESRRPALTTSSHGLDISFGSHRRSMAMHKGLSLFNAQEAAYDRSAACSWVLQTGTAC